MIRVYIVAADTHDRLNLTAARRPGDRSHAVHALQEVVELRALADQARMRALATEFHNHFKGDAR